MLVSNHLWKLINAEIVCIKFPLISYANNINGTIHSSSDKFPGADLKILVERTGSYLKEGTYSSGCLFKLAQQ